MKQLISRFREVSITDLYTLSLASANSKSKEVYIFEKGNLGDLIGKKKAEYLRKVFLKNNIKVRQITNEKLLAKFSSNDKFMDRVMSIRYINKEIFSIDYEILIFDNIVGIYNYQKAIIIEDIIYSNMQKQLFLNIWEQGRAIDLN